VKGEVCLKTVLWHPRGSPFSGDDNDGNGGGGGIYYNEDEDSQFAALMEKRRSMVVELPAIFAPSDWTLSQLKARVLEVLQSQEEMGAVAAIIGITSGR